MFRPVRRKDKAIADEAARELLRRERIGVLAVNGDDHYPYAVPINFLYDENAGKIFFHGAKAGHKYDSLKTSDQVCFTVYGEETVRDLTWAPYVRSVVVFGRCRMLDPGETSAALLRRLAGKYYPDAEAIEAEMAKAGHAAQMFEIEIEHLAGKELQER